MCLRMLHLGNRTSRVLRPIYFTGIITQPCCHVYIRACPLGQGPLKLLKQIPLSDNYVAKQQINESIYSE